MALRRKGAGLKIDAKFVQADAFMVSQRVFLIILVNPCLSSPSQNVLCYAQVGNMDLEAFIEAAVRKRTSSCVRRFLLFYYYYCSYRFTTGIKPHIKNCEAGYKGAFCDVKCTNADLSKEMYTDGCTTVCKKGFGMLKGKCISKSDSCNDTRPRAPLISAVLFADVAGAPCNIPNSNKKPGKACKCKPFYGGEIAWKGAVASGKCQGGLMPR